MKKVFLTGISLLLACMVQAQIVAALQELGMENIRSIQVGDNTITAFENNVDRGTYRGIGKAVMAAIESEGSTTRQLVVLDNGIPQLCITLPATLIASYKSKAISLRQVYEQMGISYDTDGAMKQLKKQTETANSSAWKTDIIIYPDVLLRNSSLHVLYTYAVNLSPAIETTLWKGAMLTAQVIFPVATNLHGEYKRIRPGILTFSQEVRLKNNFFGKFYVGNFSNNRLGASLEMKYYLNNGRMNFGARIGSTSYSGILSNGWNISRKQRIDASVSASRYIPKVNLQIDLQASRYVYGDYGVRGDVTRYFGEYAIGLYGIYTQGEKNGGFHFSIPFPGKKRPRRKYIRIMQPENFRWEYSMVSWGKYMDKNMAYTYKTEPVPSDKTFYQPDYIRYFLLKELKRTN